jgi:PBSX family phage terminase large subunit
LAKHNQFKLFRNTLNCFGADDVDAYKTMTGMTSYGWLGNEMVLQHENTVQEAFNRCSGEGYRILWDTNTDYPEHPIKISHINKSGDKLENGRLRIKAWHFKITDNPYLPKEYIENLIASTPEGMWYDRTISGLWVAAEGLVYTEWDPNIHVIEPFEIPKDWQRVRGIDLGYGHPFVCLFGAIDNDGRLYIYDEHYEAGKLISHHAAAIKQRGNDFIWTVRDHEEQVGAELEAHGINTEPAKKDVLAGIQKVAARLKVQGDGRPRLFVTTDCPKTRWELGKYQWLKKKAA